MSLGTISSEGLNGKQSALRWILGYEWDKQDTLRLSERGDALIFLRQALFGQKGNIDQTLLTRQPIGALTEQEHRT